MCIRDSSNTTRGYHLQVEEAQRQEIICTTCFPYLKEWDPLENDGDLFYFHTEMILHLSEILPEICRIVQNAEHQYDITIADISYKQTVFLLAILCKSLMQGQDVYKRQDLYGIPAVSYIIWNLKQAIFHKQIFFRRIVPVQDKPHGQGSHCRSFNAEMGVSPVTEFLFIQAQIFAPDIKSAHESNKMCIRDSI